ncbi:MAG: CRTAC1 family protein, partial [Chloroflexota bacterium]
PLRLYELNERGLLIDGADEAGIGLVTGGRSVLSLPMISDRMDIFCGNENGMNFLFVNQGNGTFSEVARGYGLDDPGEHARGVAALDANDDGRFDLIYGNWEGFHRLFIRQGDEQFTNVAPPEMARPSRVRTVIAADFDNDGYEEIFFNNIGQPNRLFARRDDAWVQVDIGDAAEPEGLGTGAAVGDFDHDGRLELVVSHGEAGAQPLTLYHVEPNDHHWLRVRPLTLNGAPARGAVIRLMVGGRLQLRTIDAGSGYLCQMEPVAHFGLGMTDVVTYVEVQWPDGSIHRVEDPGVDHTIDVPHPGRM